MSENSKKAKTDLIKLILLSADDVSTDRETANAYLISEGLNPEAIGREGAKRVKRLQLRLRAIKTEKEMTDAQNARDRATQWVEDLLGNVDFSFADFVKKEQLVLQNRNLEALTPEDIRNTMISFYTLKFLDENTHRDKHY